MNPTIAKSFCSYEFIIPFWIIKGFFNLIIILQTSVNIFNAEFPGAFSYGSQQQGQLI